MYITVAVGVAVVALMVAWTAVVALAAMQYRSRFRCCGSRSNRSVVSRSRVLGRFHSRRGSVSRHRHRDACARFVRQGTAYNERVILIFVASHVRAG